MYFGKVINKNTYKKGFIWFLKKPNIDNSNISCDSLFAIKFKVNQLCLTIDYSLHQIMGDEIRRKGSANNYTLSQHMALCFTLKDTWQEEC
jgi:hypothetical protein